MATKRRLKHACEYCQERFATPQAKWGHYPQCEARKLSLDPASKPEAQAPSEVLSDRRPGPDSQEMKFELLNFNEDIIRLYSDAEDHTFWADFFSRTARNHVQGCTTPEEWVMILHDLGDILRDVDQMKGRLRLDRSLLFNIYHKMLAIEGAWLNYQARDFSRNGELTPEGEEVLREERALFADLMLKVKKMLVAAR
jgi:hypothetical protein